MRTLVPPTSAKSNHIKTGPSRILIAIAINLCFCGVLALKCMSHPVPVVRIATLEENSTLIVAGAVIESTKTSSPDNSILGGESVKFKTVLSCDLILKGHSESRVSIETEWKYSPVDPVPTIALPKRALKQGDHIIAFLVESKGQYTFTDLWRPFHRISSSAVNAAKEKETDLETFIMICLDDSNPSTVCEAIDVLSDMKSEQLMTRIDSLVRSRDPLVSGAALVNSIKAGKGQYLTNALDYIENVANTPETASAKLDIVAYIGTLKDRACLPILHKLVSENSQSLDQENRKCCNGSYSGGLRRSAMQAIHNTACEESVPCLIQALDDKDEEMRYSAALALNKTLGHPDNGDGLLKFDRKDYGAIVTFWKTWWQTEDAAKYRTAQ